MELMIDLETMSNTPDSAIVALGAVPFNSNAIYPSNIFYATVNLEDSIKYGRVNASTILWWLQQNQEARHEITHPKYQSLKHMLSDFSLFYRRVEEEMKTKIKGVWGNGAEFDNVILTGAFNSVGYQTPWKYYENRCYRTLKAHYPQIPLIRYFDQFVGHRADHDAINQAHHCMRILYYIKNSKLERAGSEHAGGK